MTRVPGSAIDQHPIWEFYSDIEVDVLEVRSALFSDLDLVSPEIAAAASRILYDRLERSEIPLLGEFLPWILRDLTQADKRATQQIAVGWLALYIYTLFLDDYFDRKDGRVGPDTFLAGAILAEKGLLSLHNIVVGTEYQGVFEHALREAALGQFQDIVGHSRLRDANEIQVSARKKNGHLIACAGAFAALLPAYSDFVLDFTKSAILAVQSLDDVGDWRQDCEEHNITGLLAMTAASFGIDEESLFSLSQEHLLEKLVVSGSLRRVLEQTKTLFEATLSIMSSASTGGNLSKTSEFLIRLQLQIDNLISLLHLSERDLGKLPKEEYSKRIAVIQRGIQLVAFHT